MVVKFFSENELEKYYGKEFRQISPTDKPLNEYMAGHSNINCNECNNKLDVVCSKNFNQRFQELAYCNTCKIKYIRNRAIVDIIPKDSNYYYEYHRTDEREEYLCKYCRERHPFTQPMSEFKSNTPQINSLENTYINCKCGRNINVNNVEFPKKINCPKCSRIYTFDII